MISRDFPGAVNIGPHFWAFPSVRASSIDIQRILDTDGVIATRDHPGLRGAIEWRVRSGDLTAVLPGVYAPAATAGLTMTRIAALGRWDPDAILTHQAAASISFWPKVPVLVVHAAVRHQRAGRPGFRFSQGRIPAELVAQQGSVRLTTPALTALDLCDELGGTGIDRALLARSTTLDLMREALELTAGRTGNRRRRQLLLDSRDEPWSEAERGFHQLLRGAGIAGWKANRSLVVDGTEIFPDVIFRRLRLVIEVDGREFHTEAEVFESDRNRQNLLVLHGWRVLRITWNMITHEPERVITLVQEAVAQSSVS